MNVKTFVCHKYIYQVKYNGLAPIIPRCKWPKEQMIGKIRKTDTIFMEDDTIKKISYPKELCYTEIQPDDLVEHMLIYIKETIPDWVEIKVDKIDNKNFL